MGGYSGYPPPQQPGSPGSPGYPGYPADNPQGYGPRGPADDHLWALLAYLLTFVAGFLAPLIIYLVKVNESRYVRYHAAQSLNMAITGFIYVLAGFLVSIPLVFVTHGFGLLVIVPAFIAYGVAHLAFLILAAIRANQGEQYRVPAVIALPMVR